MVSNSGETISAVVARVVERAAQEPGLLLQHQHLEQVADALGVRDDRVAQRLAAVAAQHLGRGLEDRELLQASALYALVRSLSTTRSGRASFSTRQQERALRRFVQRAVVALDAGDREQLGDDRLVLVGALAQVDGREVEAEHLRGADQRLQARPDQRLAVVRGERLLDGAQVGEEIARRWIGIARRDRVAQRLGAGERVQRRRQARVDADQCAPVRLVLAMRVGVARRGGEPLQRRRHRLQHRRDRQLAAELVHFGEVVAQRRLALARERGGERRRVDEGVAVAVAADPVAHAEEARDRAPGSASSTSR